MMLLTPEIITSPVELVSMCVQNCIKIFHMVQERASFPFSEFGPQQNLDQDKWDLAILWVRSCQYAKFDQNIPSGSRVMTSFAN